MKNTAILLAALAACAGIEGCALPAAATGEPRVEPVYVTGSNIARRDRTHSGEVSIMSPEAYEMARMGHTPGAPLTAAGGH
ncbi:MAG TPA: hypothetical protein VLS49_06825 [Usitatibacter sp.]|nr:hypothetical protein [Usitatibacter sp.]